MRATDCATPTRDNRILLFLKLNVPSEDLKRGAWHFPFWREGAGNNFAELISAVPIDN